MRNLRIFSALCLGLAACSSTPAQPGTPGSGGHADIVTKVTTQLSPAQQAELDSLSGGLDAAKALDAASFAAKYAVPFRATPLGYDARSAQGLDLLQQSQLALNDTEQAALGQQGFVISDRRVFPSFMYGYRTIYLEDLPVYISADSILYAVHESYDLLLQSLELQSLTPTLLRLLTSMRERLQSGAVASLPAASVKDVDTYLSVTKSLLSGKFEPPVAGGDATLAAQLFNGATAATGEATVTLFGVERQEDFSQFKPRGHYTYSEDLRRYFRAMVWLGRIDFRILETQPDHTQVFHRRQLEAAFVLGELIDETAELDWKRIDSTIEAFVGEPDSMTLPQLQLLLADLHVKSAADLARLPDQTIAQAIVSGGYGTQRISSHIMINGLGSGTMPLSSAFLLFGQRYVLDSHVFSNVVYDRVRGKRVLRMLPNPLDVAFAALGNDQAGMLLAPELATYEYATELASMRVLADAHPQAFWDANLYNLWLGALRTLSPNGAAVADPAAQGLPGITSTEAWGRRLLNTQLASWAELRHDTILYAKQSYTGGNTCEFPDAYVDPYPDFYAKLGQFADHGARLIGSLDFGGAPSLATQATQYFANLGKVAGILGTMAQDQRTGTPHSAEHIAFINQAVTIQEGCGSPAGVDGWYTELFFNPISAVEFDPVIADVHTQPTDEQGNPVGKVLHVGTGMPRLFVVTVESCNGPHAYVGLVSSYFEKTTEQFQRLDDEQWQTQLQVGNPPDVPWMQSLVAR